MGLLSNLFKTNEQKEFEKQLKLAQSGDAEAQYLVFQYYNEGIGVEQNLAEAARWLEESAKNGHGGAYYQRGRIMEKNDSEGTQTAVILSLYQKALDCGYIPAAYILGNYILYGIGCERSIAKALAFYRVAFENEFKNLNEYKSALDVISKQKANYSQLCSAAKTGDAEALYKLAVLLWQQNIYDCSFKFMEVAASFGNMNGVYELGRNYYYGYGVSPNREVSMALWNYAAENGNAAALREVGDCYTDEGDFTKAFEYYMKAANLGDDKGRIGVAESYLKGDGVEKNVKEAIHWLNDIISKNNAQSGFNWNAQWVQCAMMYLGAIYLGQEGEEFKDINKGINILKEALNVKDRFTSQIANILADIYGGKYQELRNPKESQKYRKIAEESKNLGNVRYAITEG